MRDKITIEIDVTDAVLWLSLLCDVRHEIEKQIGDRRDSDLNYDIPTQKLAFVQVLITQTEKQGGLSITADAMDSMREDAEDDNPDIPSVFKDA